MIDVGGPSMLRAAAKNFAHVAAVSSESQIRRRPRGASRARRGAARHEARSGPAMPSPQPPPTSRQSRHGSPRPRASRPVDAHLPQGNGSLVRREPAPGRRLLPRSRHAPVTCCPHVDQLGGKELSYNNLSISRPAAAFCREFVLPAVVIVKHANPCGVAVAGTIEEAWERALTADPVSAFGCVALLQTGRCSAELGARIRRALRRGSDGSRLRRPQRRTYSARNRRCGLLWSHDRRGETRAKRATNAFWAACSCRTATSRPRSASAMSSSAATSPRTQWGDLLFAWRVCQARLVRNAIVWRSDLADRIGAGQMSRVDSVRIAIEKAQSTATTDRLHARRDAFSRRRRAQLALDAGVAGLIQPGGSRPRPGRDRRP